MSIREILKPKDEKKKIKEYQEIRSLIGLELLTDRECEKIKKILTVHNINDIKKIYQYPICRVNLHWVSDILKELPVEPQAYEVLITMLDNNWDVVRILCYLKMKLPIEYFYNFIKIRNIRDFEIKFLYDLANVFTADEIELLLSSPITTKEIEDFTVLCKYMEIEVKTLIMEAFKKGMDAKEAIKYAMSYRYGIEKNNIESILNMKVEYSIDLSQDDINEIFSQFDSNEINKILNAIDKLFHKYGEKYINTIINSIRTEIDDLPEGKDLEEFVMQVGDSKMKRIKMDERRERIKKDTIAELEQIARGTAELEIERPNVKTHKI